MLRKEDLGSNKSLLVYCYSSQPNFSTHENNFSWLLQPVQIRLQRVEFLIKFVFLYFSIRAEFSKHLPKVSLSKGMLKCKIFIPTLNKLTLGEDVYYYGHMPLRETKPSTRRFSYHRHNPYKTICLYKQMFTFLCCSLHRPTRPQGHLLLTDISHTGLFAHTDAF